MNHRDTESQSLIKKAISYAPRRKTFPAFLKLLCVSASLWLISTSCSIPNLEEPDCTAARNSVREFYSFHFGNDMRFSHENLALREKFLTPEFVETLKKENPETDPFTLTADTPKAFRVGTCTVTEPDKRTSFELLLFWKTDTRSEQRSINVDAAKIGDEWLVDKTRQKHDR